MNNTMALIMKLAASMIAYAVGLDLFFQARWTDVLSFSVLLTVVSYFAVDRVLLPRLGNTNALIADFFLSYMVVWIFGSVILHNYLQIAWGSIISAVIITAGEYFVHRLILRTMPEDGPKSQRTPNRLAYGMEMSEENEPLKKE